MKVKLRKISFILFYFILLCFSIILKKISNKYQNLWILAERGYDCRDNSYHLFKHLQNIENGPKAYFIIDKSSEDIKKLIPYKNIVFRGTLKHWLLFSLSDIKISTHIMGYAPDMYIFNWLDKHNLVFGKKIFIQHGVIYNNLPGLYSKNINLDLFACGAFEETKFIKKYFGFTNEVKHLGLCRFDNLYNSLETKNDFKSILLMPTWRSWIQNCKNDDEFKNTEYFIQYNELINSEETKNLLEFYDLNLIFYPHYEIQKYIHCFENKIENPRIKIASKSEYDVQNLLISSCILITDYSSVFFDFAYMKKPIFFFNFDVDRFYDSHYQQGFIDLKNNLFGETCSNKLDLLKRLEISIQNEFQISNKTKNYINNFFGIIDNKNTERTYNEIKKLITK